MVTTNNYPCKNKEIEHEDNFDERLEEDNNDNDNEHAIDGENESASIVCLKNIKGTIKEDLLERIKGLKKLD